MNLELIIPYLWLLLQTRDLQWTLVRVRAGEIGTGRHGRRAMLTSKY
jgi:hypothetical protein